METPGHRVIEPVIMQRKADRVLMNINTLERDPSSLSLSLMEIYRSSFCLRERGVLDYANRMIIDLHPVSRAVDHAASSAVAYRLRPAVIVFSHRHRRSFPGAWGA